MENLSLYQITSAFPTLMEDEEITEENKKQIEDELVELLQQKSSNIIGYCKNIELTAEAMKNEENRLATQRQSLENRLNKFKDYVKECMITNGFEKIQTELGTLSIAKNPLSVEIVNENEVPQEYKEVITYVKINKKSIADHFKQTGEITNGTLIHNNNYSLRIK